MRLLKFVYTWFLLETTKHSSIGCVYAVYTGMCSVVWDSFVLSVWEYKQQSSLFVYKSSIWKGKSARYYIRLV